VAWDGRDAIDEGEGEGTTVDRCSLASALNMGAVLSDGPTPSPMQRALERGPLVFGCGGKI